jgi:hypothetical protein
MENRNGLEAEDISDNLLHEKIAPHLEGADIKDINLMKKVDGFMNECLY